MHRLRVVCLYIHFIQNSSSSNIYGIYMSVISCDPLCISSQQPWKKSHNRRDSLTGWRPTSETDLASSLKTCPLMENKDNVQNVQKILWFRAFFMLAYLPLLEAYDLPSLRVLQICKVAIFRRFCAAWKFGKKLIGQDDVSTNEWRHLIVKIWKVNIYSISRLWLLTDWATMNVRNSDTWH